MYIIINAERYEFKSIGKFLLQHRIREKVLSMLLKLEYQCYSNSSMNMVDNYIHDAGMLKFFYVFRKSFGNYTFHNYVSVSAKNE